VDPAGRPDDAVAYFRNAASLARRWGAPGWELRAIGDRIQAGLAGDERDALLARGLELAGRLELPWVAGRLVEAARPQKTMP
jgi:hypothetical protein